jgi:hypothetical protein
MSETDLSYEREWFFETQANTVVSNFQKKSINAQYVPTRREALKAVMDMIPPEATVSRGDSVTVDEIGVIEELAKRQQKVIYPLERDEEGSFVLRKKEQRKKAARDAFSTNVYLVGSNAVTLDGKLVNVDGWGNRVSALIFGPDKVIVVAGVNKIVKNVDEALERIRSIAAPVNARRHFTKHEPAFADLPCVRTGTCANCRQDLRICNYTVIIDGVMIGEKGRINVVLVGENLGI